MNEENKKSLPENNFSHIRSILEKIKRIDRKIQKIETELWFQTCNYR